MDISSTFRALVKEGRSNYTHSAWEWVGSLFSIKVQYRLAAEVIEQRVADLAGPVLVAEQEKTRKDLENYRDILFKMSEKLADSGNKNDKALYQRTSTAVLKAITENENRPKGYIDISQSP